MKRVLLIEDDLHIKELLEIHDASIELTSKLNHGTTFKFELPLYNSL